MPAGSDQPVSRFGDVWLLGKHNLVCGNSTEAATYRLLMGDERAEFVFTDPPYNVHIDGHVSGLGRIKHREFAMASGEMTENEFTEFLSKVYALLCSFRMMARFTRSAWTGVICGRCWLRAMPTTLN